MMKILEQAVEIDHVILKENTCLVDIETTGLSKTHHTIFCIGILYYTPNGPSLKQWLAECIADEQLLLESFMAQVSLFKQLITYNGKSFDIPFIITRAAEYGLDTSYFESLPLLDLKYFNILKLLSQGKPLNRKFLENCLSIQRNTDSSGKELVKLFSTYITSPKVLYEQVFLTHNSDDLLSCYYFYELYYIFSQLNYSDIKEYGLREQQYSLTLKTPYCFNTAGNLSYANINIVWKKSSYCIKITITPEYLLLRRYLTPAKDYVFIPSQNQIIHKSIAKFIPSELKQKVSKEDCYIEKQAYFIQLMNDQELNQEIWIDAKNISYIECLSTYTQEMLWKYCKKLVTPRIIK